MSAGWSVGSACCSPSTSRGGSFTGKEPVVLVGIPALGDAGAVAAGCASATGVAVGAAGWADGVAGLGGGAISMTGFVGAGWGCMLTLIVSRAAETVGAIDLVNHAFVYQIL